ncbi:hypothetical protein AB0P23_24835 [Rhodococcus sp. NPDC077669]|uniref:helix-turn-helix transcriptional regulator n=1 Tax=Rhodococcus sp. NPDC077669 TaxID=3155174 RepID=UPI003449808B
MSPTEFEFIFVIPKVADPGDARIAAAEEHLDMVVESHGGLTLATVTAEGSDAVAAALNASAVLAVCGLPPERTYPDLVTRQDIAERAEVSRQAVGNWVRGERVQSHPFPTPVNLVGGGAWLWGDVVSWLRQQERNTDEVEFPSMKDHARIDSHILNGPRGSSTIKGYLQVENALGSITYAPSVSIRVNNWAGDSFQSSYALAV